VDTTVSSMSDLFPAPDMSVRFYIVRDTIGSKVMDRVSGLPVRETYSKASGSIGDPNTGDSIILYRLYESDARLIADEMNKRVGPLTTDDLGKLVFPAAA